MTEKQYDVVFKVRAQSKAKGITAARKLAREIEKDIAVEYFIHRLLGRISVVQVSIESITERKQR